MQGSKITAYIILISFILLTNCSITKTIKRGEDFAMRTEAIAFLKNDAFLKTQNIYTQGDSIYIFNEESNNVSAFNISEIDRINVEHNFLSTLVGIAGGVYLASESDCSGLCYGHLLIIPLGGIIGYLIGIDTDYYSEGSDSLNSTK